MEPADLLSDLLASASILSDMASAQGSHPFHLGTENGQDVDLLWDLKGSLRGYHVWGNNLHTTQ